MKPSFIQIITLQDVMALGYVVVWVSLSAAASYPPLLIGFVSQKVNLVTQVFVSSEKRCPIVGKLML